MTNQRDAREDDSCCENGFSRYKSSAGGCGGIGRRAGFRFPFLTEYRFESDHPHQQENARLYRQGLKRNRPPSPTPSDVDRRNSLPLDGLFRAAAPVTARKTATDGDDCDEPEGTFRKFLATAAFGRG
jgi:hypothetical protein